MPIAALKPTTEVQSKPNLPEIQPDSYRGIVYDDNHTPLTSLIAFVTGAPMSVDYYSQVVGEHNDLREVDPSQPGTFQQYQKIMNLEIRVEEALTSSYDAEKAITTVRGTAMVYPFLVPNVLDYFVTDSSDNQRAIFRITEVERKTFNRDSAHHIEFEMVGYVGSKLEIFTDLENKVIRKYYFSKDRLIEGLSPTLKADEQEKVLGLKTLYRDLVQYYFKTFYNQKTMTLTLPGQDILVYDSFVTGYLNKIVDTSDAPEIRLIRVIGADRDQYMQQPQFWDIILNKDYDGLKYCNSEMGLVNKALFSGNSYLQGIAYSNIRYIVYPSGPDLTTRIGAVDDVKRLSDFSVITTQANNGMDYASSENMIERAGKVLTLIRDVSSYSKYVLSENFYDDTDSQTVLEILTKDYLKGHALDLSLLYAVSTQFRRFKRLDQFYYGPLLMTLIKEADRAQYS